METESKKTTVKTGAFTDSLKRNNEKIREDRANVIAGKANVAYRRKVEDLQLKLDELKAEQESLLDLSPTDANSLILASDFDADDYVSKDVTLGIEIRNTEIKLEIAQKQYKHLFGG